MLKNDNNTITNLDINQLKLIKSNDNCIVIAGAGTGKTFTIIEKVKHLIKYKGISTKDILIISFTNASVLDIKNRIDSDVDVFTFHKLSMNILSNHHYNICNTDILSFIAREYLLTATTEQQKTIIK